MTSGRGRRRRGAWVSPVQRSPESPRPELLPRSPARPQPTRPRPRARENTGDTPRGVGAEPRVSSASAPRWPVRPRPRPGPWPSPCPGPLSYPHPGLGPRPRPCPAFHIRSSSGLGPSECPDSGPNSGSPSSPNPSPWPGTHPSPCPCFTSFPKSQPSPCPNPIHNICLSLGPNPCLCSSPHHSPSFHHIPCPCTSPSVQPSPTLYPSLCPHLCVYPSLSHCPPLSLIPCPSPSLDSGLGSSCHQPYCCCCCCLSLAQGLGLQDECQYLLQPQLIVRRLLDVAVLVPGRPSEQTLSPHNRSALYKVFVPSFTYRVSAQLVCVGGRGASACPLTLRLRPKAPPLHNSSSVACGGTSVCQLELALPPWGHWVYVRVETPSRGPGRTIRFQLCVRLQECPQPSLSRALVPGAAMNMPQSLGSQSLPPEPPSLGAPAEGPGATTPPEHCWPVRPTLRNELDTFSVHFYIFFGPSVALPPERPAVFALRLLPVLDSGGVLSLELQLNASSLHQENVTVFGCLTHEVPLSQGDAAVTCSKESLAGFLLTVSATSRVARLRIPFPQTGTWFLTLRSLCGVGPRFVRCQNATAEVRLRTFLSPCVDDCGPYGQCKLLRTHNYLYAACECKAGWRGWGCTDSADALTYGFQLLSTLLLCLSNLMFLPPVVLAIRSRYVLEAAVYTFTMFFSTFYHACDQPGIVVFCIMDYDVLQFCDFLGSLMSVWVTVIAMARLQPVVKQVLYLLGAMLLSMALQLDRHGLWNLLGPSLFALGILATAWYAASAAGTATHPRGAAGFSTCAQAALLQAVPSCSTLLWKPETTTSTSTAFGTCSSLAVWASCCPLVPRLITGSHLEPGPGAAVTSCASMSRRSWALWAQEGPQSAASVPAERGFGLALGERGPFLGAESPSWGSSWEHGALSGVRDKLYFLRIWSLSEGHGLFQGPGTLREGLESSCI
ncbi:transmembrane protein 8B isoform X2 [Camelus ferus]|uniref:Transmembrane protein 8B isoform X2 n=1 Tax=Camelus ferus TaxID=419612 RepID=A0A8B8SV17_CAMFR|nr:transmembrane protein 8B isoform X2 [Camelus ferus]